MLPVFDRFLPEKGQAFLDLNFETRFETFRHLKAIGPLFVKTLKFCFFGPIVILKFQMASVIIFSN